MISETYRFKLNSRQCVQEAECSQSPPGLMVPGNIGLKNPQDIFQARPTLPFFWPYPAPAPFSTLFNIAGGRKPGLWQNRISGYYPRFNQQQMRPHRFCAGGRPINQKHAAVYRKEYTKVRWFAWFGNVMDVFLYFSSHARSRFGARPLGSAGFKWRIFFDKLHVLSNALRGELSKWVSLRNTRRRVGTPPLGRKRQFAWSYG